jgi:hypothetical protein
VTEAELKSVEDELAHSPTFVLEVRVPELIEEVRRLRRAVSGIGRAYQDDEIRLPKAMADYVRRVLG